MPLSDAHTHNGVTVVLLTESAKAQPARISALGEALNARRKRQQAAQAGLTMTGWVSIDGPGG